MFGTCKATRQVERVLGDQAISLGVGGEKEGFGEWVEVRVGKGRWFWVVE